MSRRIGLLCGCLLTCWLSLRAQLPVIGGWRDQLSYHRAIGLAAGGDTLYCATPYSVFSVDLSDKSIRRLSKSNGLSETGLAAICYDSIVSLLTLLYENGNIDMVRGSQTYNIPAVKRALPGFGAGRNYYDGFVYQGRVYVSSDLGILVLDETRQELADTYVIGVDGDTSAVWSVGCDGQYFYAATAEGLKQAPVSGFDLADYHNWQSSGMPGSGLCRQVAALEGRLLVLQGDSVFARDGAVWSLQYADGWPIVDIRVAGDRLLICETRGDSGRVVVQSAGTLQILSTGLIQPRQALVWQKQVWIADSVNGLSAWKEDGSGESYVPNSPQETDSGDLVFQGDALWVAAGGLSAMQDGEWTNYPDTGARVLAVDPADSSVWVAGEAGTGLQRWLPGGQAARYAAGNTGGVAIDNKHNCWFTNDGAAQELSVLQPDGSRYDISIPFTLMGNRAGQILPDDHQQLWILSPGGNGVVCYAPGKALTDISDDQWRYYQTGAGQGNLPDNAVYCLAKDKSGFIWIGTANGIGVVQCPQQVFNATGCEVVRPIVQFDAFAGYLFSGQVVQTIAVDGADRKWVGTRNGVWLISSDAQQIIYHFTEDSTPLLSNDVRKIAIDPRTGEVFFETARGLCSFRSTATQGGTSNGQVLVFPNPVPPAFTGTIAIRGLVDDAIVKIVQLDGRLVYQTRALGGQAVWDGRDYKGRRVVTGVYLVLASSEDRTVKTAARIVFIGR